MADNDLQSALRKAILSALSPDIDDPTVDPTTHALAVKALVESLVLLSHAQIR